MLIKKKKRNWTCWWCRRIQEKKKYHQKTKGWLKTLTCLACGYQNSPSIFEEYENVETEKIIFWKPIKWKAFKNI